MKKQYKYYKHAEIDDNGKELPYSKGDYFVDLEFDEGHGNNMVYAPIGQHTIASRAYIKESTKITKKEYIDATNGLYTPEEYLK